MVQAARMPPPCCPWEKTTVWGQPILNLFEGLLGSVPSFANDIYFQVGFVTVMGLSAKNAILIIEFAKDLQAQETACVSVRLS
ncbi:acrB/AcrD/AcrF family protein [Neisseria meningitidis 2005040]|nr:acrB/AcrD/AcrF family protein [Neisseria meningitidis 2005040]